MRRVFWFVLAMVLAAATPVRPAGAQEWIARVKASPGDYRERVIRLRGDVVEVRGVTPLSTQGLYRLVDASDPEGILVRTVDLPTSSGPFEVQTRLPPEFQAAAPLLDEVGRREPLRLRLMMPATVMGIGLLGMATLLVLYLRARRMEKLHRLGPPLWLIPTGPPAAAGASGSAPGAEPEPSGYRLQYVTQDNEQDSALALATHRLGRQLLVVSALAAGGAGWYLVNRADVAKRPAFALLVSESAAPGTAGEPVGRPEPVTLADADPVPEQVEVPPAQPPLPPLERDTARRAGVPPPPVERPAERSVETRPLPAETVAVDPSPPVPQVLPPPPPPPPPPAPVVAPRDTAPSAPRPDPVVEQQASREALELGVRRVVAAITGNRINEVQALYPATGNAAWRNRFLSHLRSYPTEAELVRIDEAVLTDTGAQAAFTVSFRWRGNFGVERRKTARLAAEASRSSAGWEFVAVRLMESFP